MANIRVDMPNYKDLYEEAKSELEFVYAMLAQLAEREGGLTTFKMSKVCNDVQDRAYDIVLTRNDIYDCLELRVARKGNGV